MSLSNNQDLPNPATKFLRWSSDDKSFNYWDKSQGDNGKKIDVPLPLRFMVLDTLSTIKGYNDDLKTGYWSNEIKNFKDDVLTVRTKKGVAGRGTYAEIKATLFPQGAQYCQSVYIGLKDESGKMVIANLQLTGAAVSAWIDFCSKNRKIYGVAIEVASTEEGKKGKVTYSMPIFKIIKASDETVAEATALDQDLQIFLAAYLRKTQGEAVHATMDHSELESAEHVERAQRAADDVHDEATGLTMRETQAQIGATADDGDLLF